MERHFPFKINFDNLNELQSYKGVKSYKVTDAENLISLWLEYP